MRHNGRFCKSGMAVAVEPFKSMCTKTEFITQAQGTRNHLKISAKNSLPKTELHKMEAPYECNPYDSENFCWLHYNTTRYSGLTAANQAATPTDCRCSLGFERIRDENGGLTDEPVKR